MSGSSGQQSGGAPEHRRSRTGGRTGSGSTSHSLLAGIRSNEDAAWDRLVSLYAPSVYYWCRRWKLQDEDIADVFQEVFQAVASKIQTFRKERPSDTFRGWLRTITRNKVHDLFRRQVREPRGTGGTTVQVQMSQVPAREQGGPGGGQAPAATRESALDPVPDSTPRPPVAGRHARTAAGEPPPAPDPGIDPAAEPAGDGRLLQRVLERIRGHFHENTWRAFWRTAVDARPPREVGEELNMSPGAVRVAKSRVLQRLRAELGDAPPGGWVGP